MDIIVTRMGQLIQTSLAGRLLLAVKPVDMRRGIDTLTQYIQDELKSTWHEGAAFVFTNKARSRIKVLRWDKHGV